MGTNPPGQRWGTRCWARAGPSWDTTGTRCPPSPGPPVSPRPRGAPAQRDKGPGRCPGGQAWQEQFIGSPGTKSLGTCERGSGDANPAQPGSVAPTGTNEPGPVCRGPSSAARTSRPVRDKPPRCGCTIGRAPGLFSPPAASPRAPRAAAAPALLPARDGPALSRGSAGHHHNLPGYMMLTSNRSLLPAVAAAEKKLKNTKPKRQTSATAAPVLRRAAWFAGPGSPDAQHRQKQA